MAIKWPMMCLVVSFMLLMEADVGEAADSCYTSMYGCNHVCSFYCYERSTYVLDGYYSVYCCPNRAGAIAGGIVGSIIFIAIIVILCCYFCAGCPWYVHRQRTVVVYQQPAMYAPGPVAATPMYA